MAVLSEKSQIVLAHLQESQGISETAPDIAAATGLSTAGVNGVVTGLAKKGLAERVVEDGYERKIIRLTADGVAFDLNAE